jgi:inosose dehydratase
VQLAEDEHLSGKQTQRFSIGYHLNSWDLGGLDLAEGLRFLAGEGFRWFEALARDGFSNDFARRFMRAGEVTPPTNQSDLDFLSRIALFSRAQQELGLRLSSLYCNAELINPRTWLGERENLRAVARLLVGFDAPVLVIGGGPPADPRQAHSVEEYQAFCQALEEIGALSAELGIAAAYHPHLDCFVETREQLDRVMDRLDTERCGLCIDPAHLVSSGSDPVAIIRDYGKALRYVHLKDSKTPAGATGAARYAAFCELGAGVVDFHGLVAELLRHGYDGLAIIELDVSVKGAEESTRESIAYVRDQLGLDLTPEGVAA